MTNPFVTPKVKVEDLNRQRVSRQFTMPIPNGALNVYVSLDSSGELIVGFDNRLGAWSKFDLTSDLEALYGLRCDELKRENEILKKRIAAWGLAPGW